MDQCDLVFVRSLGSVLVVLVVDGAPGRATTRPRWPRETLFAAAGDAFLDYDDPEVMLHRISGRLSAVCQGRPWRLRAAAAALRWDGITGAVEVAEAGDTKAWLLERGRATALTEGGIPAPGRRPQHLLGTDAPRLRTRHMILEAGDGAGSQAVAILSDGAHALLTSAAGTLPGNIQNWSLGMEGPDDATLVLIENPK